MSHNEKRLTEQVHKIHQMDEHGTRGMLVMVERQRAMEQSLERLERTVDNWHADVLHALTDIKKAVESNGP